MADRSASLPLRILLKTLGNIGVVVAMNTLLPQYFSVYGGGAAYVIIGILISFLNVIVRPVLVVLTLPFTLTASILAFILVNGGILWLVYRITLLMNPDQLSLVIGGGIGGWIVLSFVFGLCNWMLKHVLK